MISLLMVVVLKAGRGPLSNVAGREVDVSAFNAGYDVVTKSLVVQTAVLGVIGLVAALIGIVVSAPPDVEARASRVGVAAHAPAT